MQQHFLPPSTDTTSNVSIHTLSSSSNAILNHTPSLHQPTSTSTSQITTTTEILPTSNSPNHYTTLSNTPPAVPHNTVQPSALQIPILPPIPLSLNNTLPSQSITQNLPSSSTHDPSIPNQNPFSSSIPSIPTISQTIPSTTQSTSCNPYLSLYPTFQNFPTNSLQPPPNPPLFCSSCFNISF